MILYKNINSMRGFVLCRNNLPEDGFELVSDEISDDSALEPIISSDIFDAIAALPGEFLANGFTISISDVSRTS